MSATNAMQQLVFEADRILQEGIEKYNAIDKSLDVHRGKDFNETDMEEVVKLVKEMTDVFNQEIYPLYHYIINRHEDAVNAVHTFTNFLASVQRPQEEEHNISPELIMENYERYRCPVVVLIDDKPVFCSFVATDPDLERRDVELKQHIEVCNERIFR